MRRFMEGTQQKHFWRKLTPLLLLAALVLFWLGLGAVSDSTERRQQDILEKSIQRSISYCYAAEGAYPESLDYIRAHYGLTYDESRFFVDYQVQGGNIRPEVTILALK